MANSIELTCRLKATATGLYQNADILKTVAMESTLTAGHHTTQSVGTSYEEISTGDVTKTKEYFVMIKNRSAAAILTLRMNTGSTTIEFAIVRPGEYYLARQISQTATYPRLEIKSDTASTPVEVVVCDAGDPAA